MRSIARWCVRHRLVVVGAWLLVLVGTFLGSTVTSSNYATSTTISGTPSGAAASLLQRAVPGQSGDTEQIVFQAKTGTVNDPAVRARISAMLGRISHLRYVSGVTSPYSTAGAKQISAGKTVAFATVNFTKDANSIPAAEATRLVHFARAPNSPGLQVDVVGDVAASTAPTSSLSTPIGIAAALIVLLVFFGAVLPALVPLASAVIAVMSGLAAVDMLSNSITMASFTSQLCILIGLGVGIDYSLFILTRTRNGLRRGLSVEDAVTTAAGTAGRAVLFAGLTVCVALLGILTVGVSTLSGAAIAASIAVVFAVTAALTLLPALMGLLGTRLLTRRQRRALDRGETGFTEAARGWSRWGSLVQRHRLVCGIGALGVMLALGAPFLSMRQGTADYSVDPTSTTTTTYRGYEMLVHGFGAGFSGPLQLVAPVNGPAAKTAFGAVVAAASHTPGVATTVGPEVFPAGPGHPAVALAEVYPTGSPQDQSTSKLVTNLRDTVIPGALHGNHLQVLVGGQTAIGIDVAGQLSSKLPLFVGMVVALSFILLLVVFRSLAIPATAAIMNLLSAATAFGVITAVFQWGWLKSLAGVTNTGPVSPFIPVLMFAVLFGLTTDYQVFLVSRIQEEWLRWRDNAAAVRVGQAITGRIITAAAAIMTVVFLAFTLTTDRTVKMIGLGMAAAVIADALIVRTVLVPAVMHTLGKANWRIPSALDRVLPRLNLEGETVDETSEGAPESTSEIRPALRLCRGELPPPRLAPARRGGQPPATSAQASAERNNEYDADQSFAALLRIRRGFPVRRPGKHGHSTARRDHAYRRGRVRRIDTQPEHRPGRARRRRSGRRRRQRRLLAGKAGWYKTGAPLRPMGTARLPQTQNRTLLVRQTRRQGRVLRPVHRRPANLCRILRRTERDAPVTVPCRERHRRRAMGRRLGSRRIRLGQRGNTGRINPDSHRAWRSRSAGHHPCRRHEAVDAPARAAR